MKSFVYLFFILGFNLPAISQYRVYESQLNEINQTIIRTSDNGFLIAAIEFCYTPEEWMFEGCPIGIKLIKTDDLGDTIWTRQIVNHDVQGLVHVFENRDGTFTIFTSQDANYTCHQWTIGPDVGLLQVLIYRISPYGDKLSQSTFPDDCHLNIQSVTSVVDTTYAMLATYSEPFASDYIESRLYLTDQHGIRLDSVIFPNEPLLKGSLQVDTQYHILLFYVDKDSILRLNTYDRNLDLIETKSNSNTDVTCLAAEDQQVSMVVMRNGNLLVTCTNPNAKEGDYELIVFNRDLDALAHRKYFLLFATDAIENDTNEIIILSQIRTEEDSSDIKLTYLDSLADSLTSISFRIPGNQNPTQIISLPDAKIAMVGSHNCCNLSESIGPGQTFLYVEEYTTSIVSPGEHQIALEIYPNPANDFIQVKFNGEKMSDPEVNIYSSTGILEKTAHINGSGVISINELSSGYYYITLIGKDGMIAIGKFIKLASQ